VDKCSQGRGACSGTRWPSLHCFPPPRST
jgi:hypothetical protein